MSWTVIPYGNTPIITSKTTWIAFSPERWGASPSEDPRPLVSKRSMDRNANSKGNHRRSGKIDGSTQAFSGCLSHGFAQGRMGKSRPGELLQCCLHLNGQHGLTRHFTSPLPNEMDAEYFAIFLVRHHLDNSLRLGNDHAEWIHGKRGRPRDDLIACRFRRLSGQAHFFPKGKAAQDIGRNHHMPKGDAAPIHTEPPQALTLNHGHPASPLQIPTGGFSLCEPPNRRTTVKSHFFHKTRITTKCRDFS